jgi:transposase
MPRRSRSTSTYTLACLLKEELRLVFESNGARAVALLDAWLVLARRCRVPALVKHAGSITDHRAGIQATAARAVQQPGQVSVNTKLRLLTRVAIGFRSPDADPRMQARPNGGGATALKRRPLRATFRHRQASARTGT